MMSNAEDDEMCLLRDIRQSLGFFHIYSLVPLYIHPIASHIFENLTAYRLDVPNNVSTGVSHKIEAENAEMELRFDEYYFRDLGIISKEIECAIAAEMDVHMFALTLPEILREKIFTMQFVLIGPLVTFAVTYGVWLLALKCVCGEYREEGLLMVIKKVERLFISLEENLERDDTRNDHDFCMYISLLASSVTREPKDNWKSMSPLYILINAMFEVGSLANLIYVEVYNYVPEPMMDEFGSLVLLCIYWITSGVFICSSQCNKLPKNGYVIQDSRRMIDICDNLKSIHKRLMKIEASGKQYIYDEKITNAYQIPDKERIGSYYALMALFGLTSESEDLKLFRCDRKDAPLPVAGLKERKITFLLISELDISINEIKFLKHIYVQSKTSTQPEFDFIWLPIHCGPWTESLEVQYTNLLQMMPWATVEHPSFINERTKEFMQDIWKFYKKPIIVVINEDGRVVYLNAIHLIHIWGLKAIPFTQWRERNLWFMEKRLDSLILGFDPKLGSMIEAGNWVILYGGSDIEWIGNFNNRVREVSSDSGIVIETVYVGKNREMMSAISKTWPHSYSLDIHKIWYFWTRLESLLISRYQTVTTARNNATDPIFLELKKMLSYATVESWACLCIPSSDLIIHGIGETLLKGFMEYEEWKQNVHTNEFAVLFQNRIKKLERQESHDACSHIILHIDNKDVVESLECPNCSNFMEKKIQYKCCHTHEEFE